MNTVPRATVARAGRGSRAIRVGHVALTEVRWDVGGTARSATRGLGRVLGFVEGQVAHLETVGHDCELERKKSGAG